MAQFIDRPVTVSIKRMKEIDNLDGPDTPFFSNDADFQSFVTIDGRSFSGKKFEGKNNLDPGTAWTFTNGVSGQFVPMTIEVLEIDDPEQDDRVDINPQSGKKNLNLTLDLLTGRITNSDNGQFLGMTNQTITLRGAGDTDRGEISFVVSGSAGSEPDNSVFIGNVNKPFFGQSIQTGDFNADGKADLVSGSPIVDAAGGSVFITPGSPNGINRFAVQSFSANNLGTAINGSALAVGDINGDGVDDLVMGGAFGDAAVIRFGLAGVGLNGQNNIAKDPRFTESFQFGETVAAGDFNGDGKDDVVLGDPFATTSGQSGSGTIQVNYGSAAGITTNNRQVFHRDTPGIAGRTERNTNFGAALATGDINADGFEDLVVGASGASDTVAGAGAFHILYGSANGLTTTNSQLIAQSFSLRVDKTGDGFGSAIAVGDVNGDGADDIVVGVPGRNNGAGQVYVYHGRRGGAVSLSATRVLTQSDIFGGSAEAGDRFGAAIEARDINNDGRADVIIGSPGEDDGAGTAHLVLGTNSGVSFSNLDVQNLRQGITGVSGTREAGDRFGTGLAIGNFDGSGAAEIAISAPGESFGRHKFAGMVNLISTASSSSSLFSLSGIQSTRVGTNQNETLQGTAVNGLLNGGGGRDRIFTEAGDDLAMGGAGNDYLDGGADDDLLYGGKGIDTLQGGEGRDVFVIAPKEGPDLVKDFRQGEDFIGLAKGLQFEDLRLVQRGSSTEIKVGRDRLATLQGVNANQLSLNDFMQVDLTRFEGMTVPTLVA
jgi:Ca2+-binding RTX toxin-like protein